ncbi:MAG: glycosyltransferase family 39 protein, partial [Anaerolineae bacterium]|nr:glycosyltransferase family 39 protein [Anaerolineae bacterium]
MHPRTWVLLVIALLLAAALRFYRLDAQSFWHDEGNTARLVERSLRLIVEGAAGDIHPPGYYLLLRGWWLLAGSSEFALRSFSALCGVLTSAVAAALGRRAGGGYPAVGAAFLVALHPLAVYYSQEARMYALLGLASALTLWAAVRLLDAWTWQDGKPFWTFLPRVLLLALCISLGLYTQYAYGLTLLGLNLTFALTVLLRKPRPWAALLPWSAAHALGGATFLPWAANILKLTRWRPPDLNTGEALVDMPRTLLAGITLPAEEGDLLIPVAALLILLSLLHLIRTHEGRGSWLAGFVGWAALATALLPTLLIAALNVYRPAYLKFLMVSVAPLAVALVLPLADDPTRRACCASASRLRAAGLILSRVVTLLPLLALLPVQVSALGHLYFDPAYARDDYRGLAAAVAAQAGPDDGILLNAPNQWEVFTYYYKGPLPVYPAPYHPTAEEADTWLATLAEIGHPHLFVLYWGDNESDPERYLERGLAERAYKADETWSGDIRVAHYRVGEAPRVPTTVLTATLGDQIALEGYALTQTTFAPGEILPVTLLWRVERSPEARCKVFVHLMDAAGQLQAQTDREPVGGFRPTDSWQAGEPIVDRYGVMLPAGLAPGTYTLKAGMYTLAGERLPVVQDGVPSGD